LKQQAISDFAGQPFNQLRVLDLACAEGHYAIECAMHGAEAIGIEFREESLQIPLGLSSVLTSPATASLGMRLRSEVTRKHPSQTKNPAVALAKRVLPRWLVKDLKVAARRIRKPKFRDEIRPVVDAARSTARQTLSR